MTDFGASNQIYAIHIPKIVQGLTFVEACKKLYADYEILLFAIEITFESENGREKIIQFYVNDQYKLLSGEIAYIIAKNLKNLTIYDEEIQIKKEDISENQIGRKHIQIGHKYEVEVELDYVQTNEKLPLGEHKDVPFYEILYHNNADQYHQLSSLFYDFSLNGQKQLEESNPISLVENEFVISELSDHIVVCGNLSALYHFICPLRLVYIDSIVPIVIVHPSPLPPNYSKEILSLFPQVYFVQVSFLYFTQISKLGSVY